MSLIWLFIASFLYTEILIILCLLLPIFNVKTWHWFFSLQCVINCQKRTRIPFIIFLIIVAIFWIDSCREMQKYSIKTNSVITNLDINMKNSLSLFRAQRNFYLSGLSVLLTFIIWRIINFLKKQHSLENQVTAALRQGKNVATFAERLTKKNIGGGESDNLNTFDKENINVMKEKLTKLENSLRLEKKDKEIMKSQSEHLTREYDRLTEEFCVLQRKYEVSQPKKVV